MIEIGEKSDARMTYAEAVVYCFLLNIDGKIGWRLPTYDEYIEHLEIVGWRCDMDKYHEWDSKHVTPVRDLKDD